MKNRPTYISKPTDFSAPHSPAAFDPDYNENGFLVDNQNAQAPTRPHRTSKPFGIPRILSFMSKHASKSSVDEGNGAPRRGWLGKEGSLFGQFLDPLLFASSRRFKDDR
jgi:hypothetical protein